MHIHFKEKDRGPKVSNQDQAPHQIREQERPSAAGVVVPSFAETTQLVTVARLWDNCVHDALRPLGLTTAKVALLQSLRRTGRSKLGKVALDLGISPQTLGRIARSLEEDGFVACTLSASGKRPSYLSVTGAGCEISLTADKVLQQLEDTSDGNFREFRVLLIDLITTIAPTTRVTQLPRSGRRSAQTTNAPQAAPRRPRDT